MGGYEGKQILGLRPELKAAFNRSLYSIADRRTKADCLDMPPKTYQSLHYDLSPGERSVYDQLAREWVAEVTSSKRISVTDGMTKSLRMAQACTGFVGDREAGETTEYGLQQSGSKLAVLKELLEDLDGKAIIWCAWRRNVREVAALARSLKLKAVTFYGDTVDKKVSELAFRNDAATRLFVGTAQSGGPGLNLQGPEVKTVIYFSQNYSVFNRLQSEDRAHRGNIKHTVNIIDICARHTIEEAIVKALRQGRQIQDFLLQDPKGFVEGKVPK
jgi:SNF2 family DNA or RNA helicase